MLWIFALLNYLYADVVALFAIAGTGNSFEPLPQWALIEAQTSYTYSHALDEISNGGLLPFNFGSITGGFGVKSDGSIATRTSTCRLLMSPIRHDADGPVGTARQVSIISHEPSPFQITNVIWITCHGARGHCAPALPVAKWSEAGGAGGMQNGYTIQAINGSNERYLSAEEVALFEDMVDDSFLDATVSIADMKIAITQYVYQNWQA